MNQNYTKEKNDGFGTVLIVDPGHTNWFFQWVTLTD